MRSVFLILYKKYLYYLIYYYTPCLSFLILAFSTLILAFSYDNIETPLEIEVPAFSQGVLTGPTTNSIGP